ncbi:MAG: acetyl-CoA C-acyltransferase [Candidatus Margulisiibacteriota bacterium]
MKERLAIVSGIRTPQTKAGGLFSAILADDLGAIPVKEVLARTGLDPKLIDEVILGNVSQPAHAANIARVVALKAGLPVSTPAFTVHRNCASGFESITSAANKIFAGEAEIILAGGTESMSNIPLLYNPAATTWFAQAAKAKTTTQKLKHFLKLRPSFFFKPKIGLVEGLTDPTCGLIMGLTAENLARDFAIPREVQDQFALESHQKASKAQSAGTFDAEMVPVPVPPQFKTTQTQDDGPRATQTLEALAKLKPYFDRNYGSVTVGNACPITDGAAAVIVMSESKAKAMGYTPLGYVRAYAYAGLDPSRMGLGPVFATAKVLNQTGLSMQDIDLIELNEAFAVQVLANIKAFESDSFAQTHLGQSKAVGALDPSLLNVNGGGIALGHPVGMTGTRLVITLLHELRRRGKHRGLATLCIGGGQGGSLILETE